MNERIYEGRLAEEIARGDRSRRERLKAMARALVGVIREGLVRDGVVRIHGFGTFRLRRMPARAGRNPRTGERITIPPRNRVMFRPAKALRERIEPERPPAVPVAEPHPSREATLGAGGLRVARPWGTVPATVRGPGQSAAAGPADTVAGAPAGAGSREAGLGTTGVRDRHPAGALAPTEERLPRGAVPGEPDPEREWARESGAPGHAEAPVRGSREATLGAEGLRVTRASGTVPSVPADDERPPAYADAEAPRGSAESPHASREASLGGTAGGARAAGGLASEDEPLPRGSRPGDPDPEREWAHDAGTRAAPETRGSREASLGSGGLRVSRPWGTVPATAPDDERAPAYSNSEPPAGRPGGAHASREAGLEGRAAATRPAGELPREDEGDTRAAADDRDALAAMPAATERSADTEVGGGRHRMARVGAAQPAPNEAAAAAAEPETPPEAVERRRAGPWVLALLLLALLGVALWLFWPVPEPTRVAGGTDAGGGTDEPVTAEPAGDTQATPSQGAEPGTQAAGTQVAETQAAETQPAETGAAETQAGETRAAETQAAETEAAGTQAAETEPAETEPAETQAAEAQAAETEAAETEAAETEAAETQAAETEAAGTQAAETQAAETEAAGTQAAETEAAETQAAETQAAETEPAETQAAEAQAAETEAAETEAAETQAAETQVAGTQPAETEAAETQAAETQVAETEAAETQVAGTQPAETEAAEAQAAETQVAETQVAETEAAETQVAGTQPAETEAAEAQAAETQAAESGATGGEPFFAGREYVVERGDTLWGLADRHYVNPYYWPHIWNRNEGLSNPDRIEIEQLLWLPTLQGGPQDLTAADRRSIAEGYLRLYRFFQAQGAANPQYALVGVRYFDPSVLPPELRGTAAGQPADALAAAFQAQLRAHFPVR